MTVAQLREFGANVDEAMKRCLNNETFYLTLVGKALRDPSFERLRDALEQGDLDRAFELAHSLKGVTGNLSLTPIYCALQEMTDLLRKKAETDYSPYMETILGKKKELEALL